MPGIGCFAALVVSNEMGVAGRSVADHGAPVCSYAKLSRAESSEETRRVERVGGSMLNWTMARSDRVCARISWPSSKTTRYGRVSERRREDSGRSSSCKGHPEDRTLRVKGTNKSGEGWLISSDSRRVLVPEGARQAGPEPRPQRSNRRPTRSPYSTGQWSSARRKGGRVQGRIRTSPRASFSGGR
jgi:hypothetical protein